MYDWSFSKHLFLHLMMRWLVLKWPTCYMCSECTKCLISSKEQLFYDNIRSSSACKCYFLCYSQVHVLAKNCALFLVLNLIEFDSTNLWDVGCPVSFRASPPLPSSPNQCSVKKCVVFHLSLTHLMSEADPPLDWAIFKW